MLGRVQRVQGSLEGCRYLEIRSFIFQEMGENLQLPPKLFEH